MMSSLRKTIALLIGFGAIGWCAYTYLLNDEAKERLGEASRSVLSSARSISGYWDDLFGKGVQEEGDISEHQASILQSWKDLGY